MKKQITILTILIVVAVSSIIYSLLENNDDFQLNNSILEKLNLLDVNISSDQPIFEKIKWAQILDEQGNEELSKKVLSKIKSDHEIEEEFRLNVIKYDTENIELVETKQEASWTAELYRNNAYPCSLEGYQTFVLAYKNEIPKEDPHPLLIRLHGGGIGSYFPNEKYHPSEYFPSLVSEESFEYFDELIQEEGLAEEFFKHPANFRMLIPSMCNHDAYSGIGTLDVYNPNLNSNQELKSINGLLATRAALEFSKEEVNNTHIFVHGLSAGGVGAMNLIISLGQNGEKLSGAVLDSAIFYPYGAKVIEQRCTDFEFNFQTILNRIGYFFEIENQPHNAIEKNLVLTPIYNVWVSNDERWSCGEKIISIKNNGELITQEGNWFQQNQLNEAIEKINPNNVSEFHRLCVDNVDTIFPTPKCSKHAPTKYNSEKLGGDKFQNGEDYNKVIFEWIKNRLGEPYP